MSRGLLPCSKRALSQAVPGSVTSSNQFWREWFGTRQVPTCAASKSRQISRRMPGAARVTFTHVTHGSRIFRSPASRPPHPDPRSSSTTRTRARISDDGIRSESFSRPSHRLGQATPRQTQRRARRHPPRPDRPAAAVWVSPGSFTLGTSHAAVLRDLARYAARRHHQHAHQITGFMYHRSRRRERPWRRTLRLSFAKSTKGPDRISKGLHSRRISHGVSRPAVATTATMAASAAHPANARSEPPFSSPPSPRR